MADIADKEVQAFFESYLAAYQKRDAASIALHFRFPLQITGDAGQVTTVVIPSIEAYRPRLEQLLAFYKSLDVATAEILSSQITRFSPRLATAGITWRLVNSAGATVYEFEATYTLAASDDGLKVVAIAFNEQLRAREAMAKKT